MATAAYTLAGAGVEVSRTYATSEARDLRAWVDAMLGQGETHLVVDGSAWNQLDVSMLSALVRCASACRAQSGSFSITNVSRSMKEHLRELSLHERLGLLD